ncbi:MAG: hypothetical protein HYX27_14900 [Acidobacteria bacterium]|nr:hypothetical protein [Acidobacteriota bacterium]
MIRSHAADVKVSASGRQIARAVSGRSPDSLAVIKASCDPPIVVTEFDFRLHADRSECVGTQYFELLPGPYRGKHWVPGARFIDEYTFSLFEGIFERHLADYDHFAFVDVLLPQWQPILTDLSDLQACLLRVDGSQVDLPFGRALHVKGAFEMDIANNQRGLAWLTAELRHWLSETLTMHDCISVLGL